MSQSEPDYEVVLHEFIDRYQLDHESVVNYRRINWVSNLALAVILISVSTIFYNYILTRAFPDFILTGIFKNYPLSTAAVLSGFLGVTGFYLSRSALEEYPFGKGDVVYHYLAMSVSDFFDGNHGQSLSHLSRFTHLAERDRTARIHAMRLGALNQYLSKLRSAEQRGRLQSAIENTYIEFVGEICRQIDDIMNDNQLIGIVVGMDVPDEDSPSWEETVRDLIDPLTSQTFVNYTVVIVLMIVAVIVGLIESPGWSMVIIALYLAYKA